MNCSTRILIIDTDTRFYENVQESLSSFDVEIDLVKRVESRFDYDFYFLGEVIDDMISCIERIRATDPHGEIFVFDGVCNDMFPLKKILHLNISGCINKTPKEVNRTVGTACKAKSKIYAVAKRLDDIKKEMLDYRAPLVI